MLLPFQKVYSLQEIKSITQTVRNVDVENPKGTSVSITVVKTWIELTNSKQIKLYTISPLSYAELSKTFNKLKKGEENLVVKKMNLKVYLIDNLGGLAWTIFFLLIVIGLFHGILTK